MNLMSWNCRCSCCGRFGRRAVDIVIYQMPDPDLGDDPVVLPLCNACACIRMGDGYELSRIQDQSGNDKAKQRVMV